jgi:hypothetical protein
MPLTIAPDLRHSSADYRRAAARRRFGEEDRLVDEFPVSKYEREPGVQPVRIATHRRTRLRAKRGMFDDTAVLNLADFTGDREVAARQASVLSTFGLWNRS